MKTIKTLALAAASLLLGACAQEEDTLLPDLSNETLEVTLPAYQPQNGTRLAITPDLHTFTWTENDKIGIYAQDENGTAYAGFSLTKGENTNIGTFANRYFSLNPETTYYAFYPFSDTATPSAAPVDFTNQIQTENGGTSHIAERNYMVAPFTTDANGSARFEFQHLATVLQLKLTVPADGTYSSVTLTSDKEKFIARGTVSMKDATITPTETSPTLVLTLASGLQLTQGEPLTANFLVAPVDLSASTLEIQLTDNAGKNYTFTMDGIDLETGKTCPLDATDQPLVVREALLLGGRTLTPIMKNLAGNVTNSTVTSTESHVQHIVFHNQSAVTSSIEVQTVASSQKIYLVWDASSHTLHFHTPAEKIVATDLYTMFYQFDSLLDFTWGNFDTSRVTDMWAAFFGCKQLTSLDLSHFDTRKVTNMGHMFGNCLALKQVNISSFDTSSVTDMKNMFANCRALTKLDVSHFNTSKVTAMNNMFEYCESVTSLGVTHFNTSKVTNMYGMFSGCSALTSLDVTHFDTSLVTNMGSMFSLCRNLTTLDLTNFKTSKVTDMKLMFYGCDKLEEIKINTTLFDTQYVTNMRNMFSYCYQLKSIDVSHFYTAEVTDMWKMFQDCLSLTDLDLSSFNTSKVVGEPDASLNPHVGLEDMITGCTNLSTLKLGSGFTVKSDQKTNMLTSLPLTCTITCSSTQKTALSSGTNLPSGFNNWNIQ